MQQTAEDAFVPEIAEDRVAPDGTEDPLVAQTAEDGSVPQSHEEAVAPETSEDPLVTRTEEDDVEAEVAPVDDRTQDEPGSMTVSEPPDPADAARCRSAGCRGRGRTPS